MTVKLWLRKKTMIIGSKADLELLEEKKSGRILVLSDSHGDAELVRKIIVNFGIDCDALVFCGDGIYEPLRGEKDHRIK